MKEILARLHEFFDDGLHKVIRKGGADTTHVPVWYYVDRLNEVDPEWSMERPIVSDAGGKLVIGVGITVGGVTRWNFGDEEEARDNFGTACTNAWAQAFKRTCATFGLGRYLYEKEIANKIAKGGSVKPKRKPKPKKKQASLEQKKKIVELMSSHVVMDEERDGITAAMKKDGTPARATKILKWLTKIVPERKEAEAAAAEMMADPQVQEAVEALDLEVK